jgi:sugar O-acyltransferase (sialic acid O-acetyltransferase NeuD family)
MKKLLIFGASYPIIIQTIDDINRAGDDRLEIIGFLVDDPNLWEKDYFGFPIVGRLEDIPITSDTYVINNVGGSTHSRYLVDKRILKVKPDIPSIIHPTVERTYSEIGSGCILSKDVFIGAGSIIGNAVCIRNTTFIGNEVKIGNYVFISDQSVILGYVKIEDFVYLGAHVTVLPRLTVHQNSLLGAGAVVTKDIPGDKVFVGNPAKYLKDNKSIPVLE